MASMETVCARLCLLARASSSADAPFSRYMVHKMVSTGALEGMVLRSVPEIREEDYRRAEALLSRSAKIYAKLERYRDQGYDVLVPQDAPWPKGLQRLGVRMPQFLFVRGNLSLLSEKAVAVAGSRMIAEETRQAAYRCGRQLAKEGFSLVCGGARGVDTAVQQGMLDGGGGLILVPALPAEELLGQKYLRDALDNGRLLLVCDTWPQEPFSAQKALSRNHTIYALGDAALVIAARWGLGGTWRGASDCLTARTTPVFAAMGDSEDMEGNRALTDLGAKLVDLTKPLSLQMGLDREGMHAD